MPNEYNVAPNRSYKSSRVIMLEEGGVVVTIEEFLIIHIPVWLILEDTFNENILKKRMILAWVKIYL